MLISGCFCSDSSYSVTNLTHSIKSLTLSGSGQQCIEIAFTWNIDQFTCFPLKLVRIRYFTTNSTIIIYNYSQQLLKVYYVQYEVCYRYFFISLGEHVVLYLEAQQEASWESTWLCTQLMVQSMRLIIPMNHIWKRTSSEILQMLGDIVTMK